MLSDGRLSGWASVQYGCKSWMNSATSNIFGVYIYRPWIMCYGVLSMDYMWTIFHKNVQFQSMAFVRGVSVTMQYFFIVITDELRGFWNIPEHFWCLKYETVIYIFNEAVFTRVCTIQRIFMFFKNFQPSITIPFFVNGCHIYTRYLCQIILHVLFFIKMPECFCWNRVISFSF